MSTLQRQPVERREVGRRGVFGGRLVRLLAASLIAVFVSLAGIAAPAMAACTYAGCNGKDPNTQGCDRDAITLPDDIYTGGYITLEIRYSPRCQAAWTKYYNGIGVSGEVYTIAYLNGKHVTTQLITLRAYPGEQGYTPMVSFSYTLYGCFKYYHPDYGPQQYCSDAHRS